MELRLLRNAALLVLRQPTVRFDSERGLFYVFVRVGCVLADICCCVLSEAALYIFFFVCFGYAEKNWIRRVLEAIEKERCRIMALTVYFNHKSVEIERASEKTALVIDLFIETVIALFVKTILNKYESIGKDK